MRRILLNVPFQHALIASVVLLVLSFPVGAQKDWTGEYCIRCGLVRKESRLVWLGAPIPYRIRYGDSVFHRLHMRYVSMQCRHRWRFYAGCSGPLLLGPTEWGDGRFPSVLTPSYGTELRQLTGLRDRSKVIAVLTSFDLSRSLPSLQEAEAWGALSELASVSTAAEEERWWRAYRQLYLPRLEVHRASH